MYPQRVTLREDQPRPQRRGRLDLVELAREEDDQRLGDVQRERERLHLGEGETEYTLDRLYIHYTEYRLSIDVHQHGRRRGDGERQVDRETDGDEEEAEQEPCGGRDHSLLCVPHVHPK